MSTLPLVLTVGVYILAEATIVVTIATVTQMALVSKIFLTCAYLPITSVPFVAGIRGYYFVTRSRLLSNMVDREKDLLSQAVLFATLFSYVSILLTLSLFVGRNLCRVPHP